MNSRIHLMRLYWFPLIIVNLERMLFSWIYLMFIFWRKSCPFYLTITFVMDIYDTLYPCTYQHFEIWNSIITWKLLSATGYSHSRAIAWPCMWATSCPSWASVQNPQNKILQQSPKADPSMPLLSRIIPLTLTKAIMFAIGTNIRMPHRQQLSPTASAFFPKT